MTSRQLSPEDFPEEDRTLSQDDMELRLLDMQPAIQYWEEVIEQAHLETTLAESQPGDHGDVYETERTLVNEALAELDDRWGYVGEQFLVSGRWWQPQFKTDFEEPRDGVVSRIGGHVSWEIVETEVCQTAISLGFLCRMHDGKPRFTFQFAHKETGADIPHVLFTQKLQAEALPEKISLMHMNKPRYEVAEEDIELELKEILLARDGLVRQFMNRPEFLTLRYRKQKELVDEVIADTNESLIRPDQQIGLAFNCTYAYERTDVSTGYGVRRIDGKELGSTLSVKPISGILLGVTSVEAAVLETQPLRKPQDFVDREAGLCLQVETFHEKSEPRIVSVPVTAMNLAETDMYLY